ncbi:MAG: hypothetical protein ABI336_13725 [Humibacillus sp.]
MRVGIARGGRIGAWHAGMSRALAAVEEVTVTGREVATVYAAGASRGAPFFSEAGDVDPAATVLTIDETKPTHARRSRRRGAKED